MTKIMLLIFANNRIHEIITKMTGRLQPYSEFEAGELAAQLGEVVRGSRALLEERNVLGPIHRYGGFLDKAKENVEKGQREHLSGELGHFAIVGDSGGVIGAASISPDLPLRKLRLPINPRVAVGGLAVDFPCATPNVSAWLNEAEGDLGEAYANIVERSREGSYHKRIRGTAYGMPGHIGSAWTLEPVGSPSDIHEAIYHCRVARSSD